MSEIIEHILKSQAHVVAGLMLLWTVIAAFLAFVLALVAYFGLGRLGAWRLEWKHAFWLRLLTAFWLLGAFVILGAMTGCAEGGLRGVGRVVRESQFRTEVLDRAGAASATGMAIADCFLANLTAKREDMSLTPDQETFLAAFARGEAELDVKAFFAHLDGVEAEAVERGVAAAREQLKGKVDLPQTGMAATLVDVSLKFLVRRLVRREVAKKLGETGTVEGVKEFFGTLDEAARAAGAPGTITHAELARHVVERGLIPTILVPAKAFVRSQQVAYVLIALALALVPVLGFWIGRLIERRRAAATPAGR